MREYGWGMGEEEGEVDRRVAAGGGEAEQRPGSWRGRGRDGRREERETDALLSCLRCRTTWTTCAYRLLLRWAPPRSPGAGPGRGGCFVHQWPWPWPQQALVALVAVIIPASVDLGPSATSRQR